MKKTEKVITNEKIKSDIVFLIGKNGEKIGDIGIEEALSLANEDDLDLIQIAVNKSIPVCKIMDKNKYLYELKKKEKKQNKNSKKTELKEIRISPNIADNDLRVKEKTARRLLADGCEVKITMIFKGREMTHMEHFTNKLYDFAVSLSDCSKIKSPLKINGRNAYIVLVRTVD